MPRRTPSPTTLFPMPDFGPVCDYCPACSEPVDAPERHEWANCLAIVWSCPCGWEWEHAEWSTDPRDWGGPAERVAIVVPLEKT